MITIVFNSMKTEIKRHDFVTKCFKAGVTGCAFPDAIQKSYFGA